MQRFPAPPAPYIMLTVATSLTAWTKTPSSCGQHLGHQLGPLGRGRDRVAEDVPAAGEESAHGEGIGPLHDERLASGQRHRRVGPRLRLRGLERSRAGDRGRIDQLEGGLVTFGPKAVGLGAGLDAKITAVALVQVDDDRDQPGRRIDLGAHRDTALRARCDAAPAALAELGYHEGLEPFRHSGHGNTSCIAGSPSHLGPAEVTLLVLSGVPDRAERPFRPGRKATRVEGMAAGRTGS